MSTLAFLGLDWMHLPVSATFCVVINRQRRMTLGCLQGYHKVHTKSDLMVECRFETRLQSPVVSQHRSEKTIKILPSRVFIPI